MENAHASLKNSLFNIEMIHINLILATGTFYKGNHRVSISGVDQYAYIREKKFIFQARFV